MPKLPSLKIVMLSWTMILLQLGVAIAAWGEVGAFFAHPARVGFVVVSLVAVTAGMFSGVSWGGQREDRSNRWIFIPFALIAFGLCFAGPYMDSRDLWTLDGDVVRYSGLALFLAGVVLRLWSMFVLGWRFSPVVAIQEGHVLETKGVYGVIRHPSYVGAIIGALGFALIFRSSLGVALTALMTLVLMARIDAEERLLASEFGEAYKAYRARTWRLIPHVY